MNTTGLANVTGTPEAPNLLSVEPTPTPIVETPQAPAPKRTRNKVARKTRELETLLEAPIKGLTNEEKNALIAHYREEVCMLNNKLDCLDSSLREVLTVKREDDAIHKKVLQKYNTVLNTLIKGVKSLNDVTDLAVDNLTSKAVDNLTAIKGE